MRIARAVLRGLASASSRWRPLLTHRFSPITGNQGLGAGVGRGLGKGATLGPGMNSIVSMGGLALSRVSNRFAVAMAVSSPNTSQPKLLAGLSSQDCTSATICAEFHVYCPDTADRLACTYRGRKISALRCPKDVVKKTVSPCGVVWCSWRSVTFPHGRVGGSFAPIGKQFVQLDRYRTSGRHRQIHAQAYGCDRRARRNASSNIEREHAAPEFTHAVLTGEEVKTSAVAVVALSRIVLVESVVLAGRNADHGRASRAGADTTERACEY